MVAPHSLAVFSIISFFIFIHLYHLMFLTEVYNGNGNTA